MDMQQGNIPQSPSNSSINNNSNKVDINTDTFQKIALGTEKEGTIEDSSIKNKTASTPVQKILNGDEKSAKQELLQNFISKVAGAEKDIMLSSDKGKKDAELINDFKLLFGEDAMKEDEVTITSQARMARMSDGLNQSQAVAALKTEKTEQDKKGEADKTEELEESVFEEKSGIREKLQGEKTLKSKSMENRQQEYEKSQNANYMEEEFDQEGGNKNKKDQQEIIEDDDVVSLNKIKQKAIEDANEDLTMSENENTELDELDIDEMKEKKLQENMKKINVESRKEDVRDAFDKNRVTSVQAVQGVAQHNKKNKEDELSDFEKKLFEDKTGIKDKLTSLKDSEIKRTEDKIRSSDDSQSYIEKDLTDQDRDGKNKNIYELSEEEDSNITLDKIKQKAIEDVEEAIDEEIFSDEEIEKVESQDDIIKETKVEQLANIDNFRELNINNKTEETISLERTAQDFKETKTEDPSKKREMITKYTENYRHYLMQPKKEFHLLIKNEEDLLKELGMTTRQIKDMQLLIKKNIKQEIRDKIENAIVQKQLSVNNKIDALTADTKLNKFTDYFVTNLLLGGQDFGGFDESFQNMVNKAMYLASKDLANFSVEEMESFVSQESMDPTKTKLDKIKDFEARVNELNSITNNPKITEEWAQTAMETFMKDYGLAREKINVPADSAGQGVNVMSGESGSSDQREQKRQHHDYEFDEKDEKDIFLNRLRALYLQKALNPGIRTALKTEFKIRKLKNGLLRMGVFTDLLNERIEKEAEEIAKERTMEMLEEALEEKATLYELKGNTFNLLENKIKSILKNADKLGLEISKDKFNKLRDEINYKIYEITKKQMELIEVRLSEDDFPSLVLKYREMKKLIERLKEESHIDDDTNVINERFHNISIVESA
jgi:hypothetical protein